MVPSVKIMKGRTFNKTVKVRAREISNLSNKLRDFIEFKRLHPREPFGPKDSPLVGGALKDVGLWHYDFGREFRLYYNVTLKANIVYVNLFGIFSHEETGTGTPPQQKIQQQFATKVKNSIESMEELKPTDRVMETYVFYFGRLSL